MHRVLSRNRHVVNAAFNRFDHNGDGCLSAEELTAFMMHIDPRATGHERAALLDSFFAVDKDNDGFISFTEYCSYCMPRLRTAELSEATRLQHEADEARSRELQQIQDRAVAAERHSLKREMAKQTKALYKQPAGGQ